ncbi:MAG TPA: glycosyltransferase family 2 protein [Thermoanaerobaculia bacterium]|nr:glycosyltransferase family 2 protein [Thermoanaerobaculia bacterium]
MLDQITPVVLTRDEEPNIARTLGQLRWAREVIVLDSGSTDATVAIAQSFPNVRVVERPFDSFAGQWTFAQSIVRTPWLLALDADYFVPEELAQELASLQPNVHAYTAAFRYAVGGRVLRASLYPPRVVLAENAHVRFWQDGHAQRVRVDGDTGMLRTPFIHDDRKSFRAFLDRQQRYMRQEASKLRATSWRDLNWPARVRKLIVIAPLAVLLHTLFAKALILDGLPGLRYTWERFTAELMLSRELLRGR